MPQISFQDPTAINLIAMADGLVRAGRSTIATEVYNVALRLATPEERNAILVRKGIATALISRRKELHAALLTLEGLGSNVFIGDGLATWLKTLPFLEDPRFIEIADRHAGLLPLANWHWNLQTVLWAVRQARNVEGDFVELGVFKGHTTIFCAEYLEFQTWDKHWRLFDTFEGIPEDQLDPGWAKSNDSTYVGTFSYEEVRDRFAAFPNIEVIKGRVPEILEGNAPDKIAFLHMDLNNSTAEIQALDALFDRISVGGIIVFDDYAWGTARAQYDAERAWFEARGQQILALPTGQGLYVKTTA